MSTLKIDSYCETPRKSSSIVVFDKEDVDQLEQLKHRLSNDIRDAVAKSVKTRIQSLKSISELLIHNYIWQVFEPQKLNISGVIENSLRNGKGTEQVLAAKIALLLKIQLGDDYVHTESLDQLLLNTLIYKLNEFVVRAECCSVLGLLYFMQYNDVADLVKMMQCLEDIFINNAKPTISADESVLHAAALYSYGLLATKILPTDILHISNRLCVSMKYIIKLLDSVHLNIRLASGETIALLTECGTSRNPTIMHDLIPHIFSITKYLSVNNRRNRYMQKSKSQRVTFKDIDQYIENNIQPQIVMQFGSESITLKTWAAYFQYMAFCDIIPSGINVHFTKNDFIRTILKLTDNMVYPVMKQHNKQSTKDHTDSKRTDRQNKSDFSR